MGQQQPGKKIHRKNIIRYADEQQRIATRNLKALQNAIIANANMSQMLQHEMCGCTHGATHHWTEGRLCDKQGCTCAGFVSLWKQSYDLWIGEVKAILQEGESPRDLAEIPDEQLHFWFDSSKKPPQAAELARTWAPEAEPISEEVDHGAAEN